MIPTATSIVTNEYNQVLLIQRDDSGTWATPGGSADPGELPTTTAAREAREETGLITYPVRLISVNYRPPLNTLQFVFRSLQRGGELQNSKESPDVGWFYGHALPSPMLVDHREMITGALKHAGGGASWQNLPGSLSFRFGLFWLRTVVYPRKNRRMAQAGTPYQPPTEWTVSSVAVVAQKGKVAVTAAGELPQVAAVDGTPPWETAVPRFATQLGTPVELTQLSGVIVGEPTHLTLVFAARAAGELGQTTAVDNLSKPDRTLAQTALSPDPETTFIPLEK